MIVFVFVLGSSSCIVAAATVVVTRTVVSLSAAKDGPDSVRNA